MRFGILGLGSIGARHARNLLHMGHEVIGYDPAMSADPPHMALTVNGLKWANTADAVLEADPRGLLICTPTDKHLQGIQLAPKMVPLFIEKPILSELDPRLIDPARPIMVGYNLRFHPLVQQAREWLLDIGAPIWASAYVGQKNTKYKEPVFLNWSHELDLILHLLGDANLFRAVVDDDCVDLILSHHTFDCTSIVHMDYLTEPWYRRTIIHCHHGRIEIDFEGREAWLLGGKRADHFCDVSGFDHSYIEEMKAFVEFVETGDMGHGCTAQEALRIIGMYLEAQRL